MVIHFTEKSILWWSLERQHQWIKVTASVAKVPLASSRLPGVGTWEFISWPVDEMGDSDAIET